MTACAVRACMLHKREQSEKDKRTHRTSAVIRYYLLGYTRGVAALAGTYICVILYYLATALLAFSSPEHAHHSDIRHVLRIY